MKKKIIGAAVLVVVVAAGTWAGLKYFNKEDKTLAPLLTTTQVRKGTIEVKVSGTGSIQPSARETLKADTAGTALKVNFKEGDTVKKGDVLITYEVEDNASQIRGKELDLKKKQLELGDLQKKFKEAPDDDARESLVLSIQKQELDIESVRADIAELKTDKGTDPIVAPIDGVLVSFKVKAGDNLNPNSELGEIVNYAKLQMVVGIDELDIPKVKLNQEAAILVEALPDETFAGKVTEIADEGTSSNGVASFDVTVVLTETKGLKVGMSAEASIMTAKKEDALYVPVEAVQSSQGKYFVLVPATAGNGSGTGGQGTGGTTGGRGQGARTSGQAPSGGEMPPTDFQGQAPGGGNREQFQNMTEEQRTAMREQFMANRGGGAGTGAAGQAGGATASTRVEVEVGINNEDSIEIVSGLQEGDAVVLPTVQRSGSSSMNMQGGFPGMGGGFPAGGFGGGGGGGGNVRQFSGGGSGAGGAR